MRQIKAFISAIGEIEKDEFKSHTNSSRLAQADQKDFKKALKELDK